MIFGIDALRAGDFGRRGPHLSDPAPFPRLKVSGEGGAGSGHRRGELRRWQTDPPDPPSRLCLGSFSLSFATVGIFCDAFPLFISPSLFLTTPPPPTPSSRCILNCLLPFSSGDPAAHPCVPGESDASLQRGEQAEDSAGCQSLGLGRGLEAAGRASNCTASAPQ